MASNAIRRAQPRETVRVTINKTLILEGPLGTTIGAFFAEAARELSSDVPIIAAICDGQLRELSYPLNRDSALEPVLLSQGDGGRIYRRSLVMLLTTAADELWPGCQVSVRYSVPDGGFYCTRLDNKPFTPQELEQLETRMREIVAADAPITKRLVSLDEAAALFASRGEDDKVRLLEQRIRPNLTLYTLRNRSDYYYGYMVPSTGLLRYFRLIWVRDGFILQYPVAESPTYLRPLRAYDKLSKVFRQADNWLQRLEIEDVGRMNRIMQDANRTHELILVTEALHEQNIAHIAHQISEQHRQQNTRLVLIAGPSSSGKTTFAKRLAIQLLAHGIRPVMLELDNYFVDRDLTPRDEHGEYDFEALGAVNLPLFNQHLLQLSQGETVQIPRFDFHTGKSRPDRFLKLKQNQIVIVEGIHGLNPKLVPEVPPHLIYRVYVSALTQLNIDAHNRIATTDVRLLRRIVRDARHRGYSATDTLNRWGSVRRGEKLNIFPYQENANIMFNSALAYELAALRPLAEPLLLQVEPGTPPHIEAKRLLSFLGWVRPMMPDQMRIIPPTSLLREFIGDSSLHEYHPERLEQETENVVTPTT
ncbi:MAG: nucleoside kinase [bacterium]|nr:nucleoside kinase [bacterium]